MVSCWPEANARKKNAGILPVDWYRYLARRNPDYVPGHLVGWETLKLAPPRQDSPVLNQVRAGTSPEERSLAICRSIAGINPVGK